MSDTVQIVTAVLAFLGTVFTGVMAYLMAKLNAKQAAAAVEVREVKTTLHATNSAVTQKLDDVAARVEVVHKATNGIKDELIASTDRAARAEGRAEGKAENVTLKGQLTHAQARNEELKAQMAEEPPRPDRKPEGP